MRKYGYMFFVNACMSGCELACVCMCTGVWMYNRCLCVQMCVGVREGFLFVIHKVSILILCV